MLLEYILMGCTWLFAIALAMAVDATPAPTWAWWIVALGVALSVSFDG